MKVLYFNPQKIPLDKLAEAVRNLRKIYPNLIALSKDILKLEEVPLEQLILLRDFIDKEIKRELKWEENTND